MQVPQTWSLFPNALIQIGDRRSLVSKAQDSSHSGLVSLLPGNLDSLAL